MSMIKEIRMKCEHCGKEFITKQYQSINTTLNPELREKVFNGTAIAKECPYCHKSTILNRPILYHDQDNKFMVFYDSEEGLKNQYKIMHQDNDIYIMKDYHYCGDTYYDRFVEKIVALENNIDVRLLEILKLHIIHIMQTSLEEEKSDRKITDIYLTYPDIDNKELKFHVFTNTNEFTEIDFIKDHYDIIKENFYDEIKDIDEFTFTNEMARKILNIQK